MSVPVSSILLPMADICLRLTLKPLLIYQEVGSQKLHIDLSDKSSIRQPMAKSAHDEVRKLFTEVGTIMEDASVVALIWRDGDGLEVSARLQSLSDAHAEIGDLLAEIDKAS